jgi:hypothetical protein
MILVVATQVSFPRQRLLRTHKLTLLLLLLLYIHLRAIEDKKPHSLLPTTRLLTHPAIPPVPSWALWMVAEP